MSYLVMFVVAAIGGIALEAWSKACNISFSVVLAISIVFGICLNQIKVRFDRWLNEYKNNNDRLKEIIERDRGTLY